MKKVAFIYSGDDSGLSSLEHNRNGVAEKLHDFGAWEIAVNKKLIDESEFIKDMKNYENEELDSLLIYYTGHGTHLQPSGTYQLKLSDTLGISLEILYARIYQTFEILPKKIALVLDACYSGDAIYDNKYEFGESEILASTLAGKHSFEIGFPKNVRSNMSLFSHYFCEAIEMLQLESDSVNLQLIGIYIRGFVKFQENPYSQKTSDYTPMLIVKGNKKEKNGANVETIYVRFYPINNTKEYQISVNGHTVLVDVNMSQEEIQKKVINYINSIAIPFTTTKIELILPKELYFEVLPLWREHITPHYETVICSLHKEDMADKWLPQLKKRWKNSFERCENMSFGHENVSCKVEDETMQHPDIISVIIDKKVENPRVFDGIDAYYFIALWVNECDVSENYNNLIDEVSKEKLCNVSMSLRDKIVKNPKSCISKLSFMWDNPHDLPKQGRRKE